MKSLIKSCALDFLRLISPHLNNQSSILMYHSIGNNPVFFTVRPETFEAQMKYLIESKFNLVKLSELIRKLKSNENIANHVVVTFDDGYEDNFLTAFPVLKKYNIPATIFIPTGLIGKTNTTSAGEKLPIMTNEMMKEMMMSPLVEFMPHGVTHNELTSLGREKIKSELADSQQFLGSFGGNVSVVAYPRGKYNKDIVSLATEYYQAGVTVEEGLVSPKNNLYLLPRNSIDSSTTFNQFKAKVSGAIGLYQKIKKIRFS
ncbi:MAG: polysaccharide deacetylase family protein [Candidatus Pacebacteria bacterium]|nr:polysaccharide deacetylase family protein [Candidatus Paceibacterota bacterium]